MSGTLVRADPKGDDHPRGAGWLMGAAGLGTTAFVVWMLLVPTRYPEGYCSNCTDPADTIAWFVMVSLTVLALAAWVLGIRDWRGADEESRKMGDYWAPLFLGTGALMAAMAGVGSSL